MEYEKRRRRLRKLIGNADAMLVTDEINVTYLSGFTGDSSFLVVTSSDEFLISDPRYQEQITIECPGLDAAIRKPSELLMDYTCQRLKALRLGTLIVEGDSMPVAGYDQIVENANVKRVLKSVENGCNPVRHLRMIKDPQERTLIVRAVEIAQRAFQSLRAQIMPGHTERELAHELERLIRSLGGDGCSFKPIVATGPRSALPHAVPGGDRVGDSPLVLIDWGAIAGGYRSDLTRVLLTSKIPAKIAKAYEAVLAAQTEAIAMMKPGVKACEVDRVAREVIADAGMEKRFNHGLGHGIGLDIHEAPRLNSSSEMLLAAGMVVTVEPGIYLSGVGGIRIEDDVLITQDGAQLLSNLPRSIEDNRVELLG